MVQKLFWLKNWEHNNTRNSEAHVRKLDLQIFLNLMNREINLEMETKPVEKS